MQGSFAGQWVPAWCLSSSRCLQGWFQSSNQGKSSSRFHHYLEKQVDLTILQHFFSGDEKLLGYWTCWPTQFPRYSQPTGRDEVVLWWKLVLSSIKHVSKSLPKCDISGIEFKLWHLYALDEVYFPETEYSLSLSIKGQSSINRNISYWSCREDINLDKLKRW